MFHTTTPWQTLKATSAFPAVREHRPILKVCAAVGFSLVGALAVVMLERPTSSQSTAKEAPQRAAENKGSRLDAAPSSPLVAASAPSFAVDAAANVGGGERVSADPQPAATLSANVQPQQFSPPPIERSSAAARVEDVARAGATTEPREDEIWPAPERLGGVSAPPPAARTGTSAGFSQAPAVPSERMQAKLEAAPGPEATPRAARSDQAAPDGCLAEPARKVLAAVQSRFRGVVVVSTTHLHTDNHSPGSIREKLHLACKAVDVKSNAAVREVTAFLRSQPEVGGVNSYRNGVIHFDVKAGASVSTRRSGRRRKERAEHAPAAAPAPTALGFVREDGPHGGD